MRDYATKTKEERIEEANRKWFMLERDATIECFRYHKSGPLFYLLKAYVGQKRHLAVLTSTDG